MLFRFTKISSIPYPGSTRYYQYPIQDHREILITHMLLMFPHFFVSRKNPPFHILSRNPRKGEWALEWQIWLMQQPLNIYVDQFLSLLDLKQENSFFHVLLNRVEIQLSAFSIHNFATFNNCFFNSLDRNSPSVSAPRNSLSFVFIIFSFLT